MMSGSFLSSVRVVSAAVATALAAGAPVDAAPAVAVIPEPAGMEVREGFFALTPEARLCAAGPAKAEATALAAALRPATGFALPVEDRAGAPIVFALEPRLEGTVGPEGYELDIAPDRLSLRAAAPAGLFHGGQTIRQLLPPEVFSSNRVEGVAWRMPCIRVSDRPRFAWRGLLVDPARHFLPKEDLFRIIDAMALHKFNRLQLHLTDDVGWRVEIGRYPKLTEIGSRMNFSHTGGGFYTQADIRELVAYAASRHITLVPEIEMPAHTGAAIVSYPELGLEPDAIRALEPPERWGKIKRVLAPRPETVSFMQNVLTEIMGLFPGEYIHIGGDEANTALWEKDPEMRALMERLGLKDVHALHSWFIGRMDAFLAEKGRRLIGWDEILQGGLAPGAAVMSWRGMDGGIAAARAGHPVVMAPTSHTYFDYYQGPREKEPRAIGGYIPLEKVYEFEPVPDSLTDPQARQILGGQGQLWCEFIPTPAHLEYMMFPRACALAETLWSPRAKRNGPSFVARMRLHAGRLERAGIRARPLDPDLAISGPVPAEEPFDYFANNWNVIGLKDYLHGGRLTPSNELLLSGRTPVRIRVGANGTPLSRAHGKTALHGWMPIFAVEAQEGPVRYEILFWATPMPDAKDWKRAYDGPTEGENFLNWIRVRAVNTSDAPAPAAVDIRPGAAPASPRTPEPQAEPAVSNAHIRSFAWAWDLRPGASAEGVARYPFFRVEKPEACDREDAALWLERTEAYWRGVMDRAAHIEVPCRKATEAMRAAHVCQLIAGDHGEVHGGEGFYDTFYIRDGAYQVMELEEAGLADAAAKAVELYLNRQRPDGRFESQKGQFDANGQAVWTLWQYAKITGDRAFLERVYPQIAAAARWTVETRKKTAADPLFPGLLPNAPADGEYLWDAKHHIVGYDLWNLRGLLCAADAARLLGKPDEERTWKAEADAYRADIDAAWKRTGLAHFPPSWEKAGTHWGNTETLWPTELFARDDARVAALSRHVREEFAGGFIEGTIQWTGHGAGEAIHPYMGAYTTMADLARGRHEQVVEDFYWYLLHSTAAHAFPEGIYHKKREAWSHTIPHVTGACNFAILLRHMLAHESGDTLHLLAAVPDGWLEEGREIRVERAPTHFGVLNLRVTGTAKGVRVQLDRPEREPPARIVLHLPASRPLDGTLDGVEVAVREDQQRRWDFPTVVEKYGKGGASYRPDAPSLTTGRPCSCSHALPPYPAHLANDGFAGDTGQYWATDVQQHPGPAWWQVDLERPEKLGRVVVVAYYGDRRHYGFTVETSLDGRTWEMAADRRENREPSTGKGYECRFEPRTARHIRVTQTSNSANPGRHLVEVMAFTD